MIDLPLLAAFVVAASVLALTPGVDTAMVLNRAMGDGKKTALMASVGIALGCLVWGAIVSLGLGAMLQASEIAYNTVKYAGALYLLWLGVKLLLKPRMINPNSSLSSSDEMRSKAFIQGFTTNILNPKVGVFYITFLPQFVPTGADVASYSMLLALIHVALSMLWFGILIWATSPLNRFLNKPQTIKKLDRMTGAVFILFSVKLVSQ